MTDRLKDVISRKGSRIVALDPGDTAASAARAMARRGVGCVVVRDEGGVVGIVSERDLAWHVVAQDLAPSQVALGDIMRRAEVAPEDTPVHEALVDMARRRLRFLLVGGVMRPLGMVSVGDLAEWTAASLDRHAEDLERFIAGPFAVHAPTWPWSVELTQLPPEWTTEIDEDLPWSDGIGG